MNHRRTFVKNLGLGLAAAWTSGKWANYQGSANEKVVVGLMGTNSRGGFLAKYFSQLPQTEVGFICDPDAKVLAKTLDSIEKLTGKRPQGFSDVRIMLERKDLDALVVAAPDHWHTPAAMMAMQAGKHVYVEKPCSHNPQEGEWLVQASQYHKKLVQMGSQRRTFSKVKEMIAELHQGLIGRVYFVRTWYVNNRKSIGKGQYVPAPSHLNFDLWQGPAPRKSYKDNLVHYNWHWHWHWGTGESLNNGTHELDVARWGLNVDFPSQVVSAGGRFHYQDDWETPDTQTITFNFPNNTACTWEGRSCNGHPSEGQGRGVVFYGDKGTVVYEGANGYKVYDAGQRLLKEVKDDTPYDPNNTVSPTEFLDFFHLQNFCDAIRGKARLNAPIEEGHKSTLLPQLGNIAFRVGKTLRCDPSNGHILNDKEAMALWSRTYEPGWKPSI